MPQHPMSGPDPSKPLPNTTGVLRAQPDDASFETDFADLAARFEAKSGGGLSPELSADLALEIVLNEIVEQACLATGATGAAVVLPRDGEMVCRASSGTTAPELGARLDTASGLSGECVKTRQTQRCDDVLVDQRVDVEASKRLGVRSVIVMPLVNREELLGVFELFSSEAYAFGDRDEGRLEALAGRVLNALQRAAQVPGPPIETVPDQPSDSVAEPVDEIAPEVTARKFDFATWALGAAVVICAVLLGMLLGRDIGVQKARVRPRRAVSSSLASSTPSSATPSSATQVSAAPTPTSGTNGVSKSPTVQAPRTAALKVASTPVIPAGGLRVYDNGKEVFRLPPVERPEIATDSDAGMQRAASVEPDQVVAISPAAAEGILLRRVEPVYPDDARQKGIQGAVVLEVHIGVDGTVQDVQVVSGPDQLMAASTDAVKQWRFKPRTVKGRSVEMQTTVTLNFRLPQ